MKEEISRQDWGLMEQNPEGDPGFSEEKNKQVIENTIKKAKAMRARKEAEFKEGLGERAWAASKYLKHTGGDKSPVQFFGKDYALKLKGQEIIERLKASLGETE